MARRKELNTLTFEILDGFDGTGAVNEPTTPPADTDTSFDIDTLSLADSRTIVPVGARFTSAGIATIRTVSATQNSQQWTLDMTAPSAGTFDITVNGDTAATQAYDITAATLQTNLEALTAVGAGNVTVVEDTDVYTITFAGTLANISTNTLTVDGSSLTAADSHVLTAVHDGTTTWNISFTPALATGSLPVDNDVLTFYPRKVEAKIGTGDINHTKNKDPIVDTNRGLLDGARAGTEQPMDVSFEFVYDWLRSSTPNVPTVDEVLEREGEAADWLTAAADPCEPYQVTLKVIDAPDCGSELAEVILYKYFLPQSINPSVDAAAVSVSGICVATKPVVYRVTNDSDVYGIIYE